MSARRWSIAQRTPADVRALRAQLGLTQAQMAARVYASRGGWIKWETGERSMPAAEWAVALLRAGVCGIDEIDQERPK